MDHLQVHEDNPKVDFRIIAQYTDHDSVWIANGEDPDLMDIPVYLPSPPSLNLIDGFGLPASEQKFKYTKFPKRLMLAEKIVSDRFNGKYEVTDVWDYVNSLRSDYTEELVWLRKTMVS